MAFLPPQVCNWAYFSEDPIASIIPVCNICFPCKFWQRTSNLFWVPPHSHFLVLLYFHFIKYCLACPSTNCVCVFRMYLFFIYRNLRILYFTVCKLDRRFNAVAKHKSVRKCSVPAGKPQGCLKADAYNVNITLHAGLLHRMLMVNVFRENQFQRFHFQ